MQLKSYKHYVGKLHQLIDKSTALKCQDFGDFDILGVL